MTLPKLNPPVLAPPTLKASENNNLNESNTASLVSTVFVKDINVGGESTKPKPKKVKIMTDIVIPLDSVEEFDLGSELGSAPQFEPSDGTRVAVDAENIFFNLDNIDDDFLL